MLRTRRYFWQPNDQRLGRFCPRLALLIAFSQLALTTHAIEPTFRDEMDGAQPMLKLLDESSFKILGQAIDRTGVGVEAVQLQGPSGESAQLAFSIPSAPVIEELRLSATIRCNRPGVQIAARAVLPRSHDAKTGRPHEILLRGGNISHGLPSERLVLDELPKLLERQARVARLDTKDSLEVREAFVSQLVFLVPGGNGVTEIEVDRIELHGVLQGRIVDPQLQLATSESEELFAGPVLTGVPKESPLPAKPPPQQRVTGTSSIHRIIRWQGESFDFLAQLGFNGIWLARQPTLEELQTAAKVGISLVCPPPSLEELAREGLPAKWEPVLAWDLGALIDSEELEFVARLKQQIQHYDTVESRLTVMTCAQLSRDASRATDAVLLGREMLGTDLTLRDYVTWLGQRQRIARPGTPLWVTIESEFSLLRSQQIQALSGANSNVPLHASHEQLIALTAAAMSVKSRDYVFSSESSLMGKDAASRLRARNHELINMRLQLLSPWLSTGKVAGVAHSSEPGLSAMVFQAERSHLLMPVAWSRNFQSQQSFHVPGPVSFVVPGVAESTDVYLLTLAGAKRLRHERTTGGLRVSADTLPADGLIMLTSDPQAFSQVSQYLRRVAGRAAGLHRDITAHRLQELEQVVANDPELAADPETFRGLLNRANQELGACDKNLASGDVELAYERINAIEHTLSQAEYVLRNGNHTVFSGETPLQFSVATFADEQRLANSRANAVEGPQLLQGGDFEDLGGLLQTGWRHQQLPLAGISFAVRLSPDTPHEGNYCLELEARNLDVNAPVSVVTTAPVWISSQPVPVKAGDLIEITGLARVPEELIGTVDGLQIIDSLGGPGMATRILHAPSWRTFRILRGATADTQLVVSVALSGLGKAQVDDLTVRTLRPTSEVATQAGGGLRQ